MDFDKNKIYQAIMKAMKYGNGDIKENIASAIADEIEEYSSDMEKDLTIADIELLVYQKLITKKQKLTARAYEGYRAVREFQRNVSPTDKAVKELLSGDSEYWNKENSNKNARLVTTQRDYLAGITSEDISRRFLITPDVVQAHDDGVIHFHDIDYFGQNALHNCCLINLEDMLQNGTMINNIRIEKPHKFSTAMTIATQIITSVTSSQYGGASISLTHLAPFVRDSYNRYYQKFKKFFTDREVEKFGAINSERKLEIEELTKEVANNLLKKEIEDGVQTFNYQINSMTTTNGQAPFLSVMMYLGETEEYKEELAKIIEEFLKQRTVGFKNEKDVYITPAFPKLLYVLEEDNIYENSKYWYLTKLAAKCTAKRLVPDYISEKKMKELKQGHCFPCMGCRSFLNVWDKDENKYYGRFNQGVVTLNLVDVALSSQGDFETFWNLFNERTELCRKALLIRHNRLKGTPSDVAPILWQHGALARLEKHEPIDKLLYGGYSSISLGYAGLYECVKYMTGESHSHGEGKEFGLKVMKALNDKCEEWKKLDNLGYSPYGSPIESTTYKFAKCLKKRFGIIEGITDRDYITNSYHIPVFEKIDPYSKLAIESKFQALSLGGAISYIETCNLTDNIEAVLNILKFIYEHIMYAELNTKSDYCQKCGFDGEILINDNNHWYCPNCGNKDHDTLNVARRTCGYIGSNFWNEGRTSEIKERYVHLDNHDCEEF